MDTEANVTTESEATTAIITISLKNGAGTVEVDTSQGKLPDAIYREALMLGLKTLAERGMSKITKEAYPDETERKAAIKAKAEANVQAMYEGKTKLSGAKAAAGKVDAKVMTEAMRLARNLVKDAMKQAKIKISTVKASDITAAAKVLIANDPSIVTTAEENLKAREATPIKVDITKLVHADPTLVAKAEAKAAAAKADKPLSAKQAGKVAPRVKGSKPQAQANA